MKPDDAIGDEVRRCGVGVAAVFQIAEHARARGQPAVVRFVPSRDAGVQVPAVVIEPRRDGQLADLIRRPAFELLESDDDVRHLHAGVVDVVLRLHRQALEAEQADQRVAQRGVPQVPDVRRLVGVDGCVLDDGLAGAGRGGRRLRVREPPRRWAARSRWRLT